MSTSLPPIYRDIRRLLVHTEEVVRHFSRYHKYTVGTDLRTQAMSLMRGVNRACFDTAQQVGWALKTCPPYRMFLQVFKSD
jgi:hypothetical protein